MQVNRQDHIKFKVQSAAANYAELAMPRNAGVLALLHLL